MKCKRIITFALWRNLAWWVNFCALFYKESNVRSLFLATALGILLGASSLSLAENKPDLLELTFREIELRELGSLYDTWYSAVLSGKQHNIDQTAADLRSGAKKFFNDRALIQVRVIREEIPDEAAVYVGLPANPTANPVVSFNLHAKGAKSTDAMLGSVTLAIYRKKEAVEFSAYGYFFKKR